MSEEESPTIQSPAEARELLDLAIKAVIDSSVFGAPVGMVMGWVVIIGEQELTEDDSPGDEYTVIDAPHQSRALTSGLIRSASARTDLGLLYARVDEGEEDEEDPEEYV